MGIFNGRDRARMRLAARQGRVADEFSGAKVADDHLLPLGGGLRYPQPPDDNQVKAVRRVPLADDGVAGSDPLAERHRLRFGKDGLRQALEQFAPCQYGEVRMHHVANRASRRLSGFNDIARASPRRM